MYVWVSADGTGPILAGSHKASFKKYLVKYNTNDSGAAKFSGDSLFYRFFNGGEQFYIGRIAKMVTKRIGSSYYIKNKVHIFEDNQ